MIINDLKSTWKLLKLTNSLNAIDHEEILKIIAPTEELISNNSRRLFSNLVMFLFLLICCQGG